MRTIEGARCPSCGGPLTYEAMHPTTGGGTVVVPPPSAREIALCLRCVALVLCQATVAIHGDVGDAPQSHHFPGHDDRMRGHEDRMRQAGMNSNSDDDGAAAVPA